jgi:hypothetical protein
MLKVIVGLALLLISSSAIKIEGTNNMNLKHQRGRHQRAEAH